MRSTLIFALVLHIAQSAAVPTSSTIFHDHDNNNHVAVQLPDSWYHPENHPVHSLFRRATGDGAFYPTVGTPAWSAGFPQSSPDPNTLPVAWVNALNAAVADGKIPNIPRSTNTPGVNPIYPTGVNPNGAEVCSATYKCKIPGDIWDSPDGVFASSFDDGPTPSTPNLVNFLNSVNQTTTHFMIGVNMLYYPNQFLTAFNAGNDIAVHTWTHPYMTTLGNLDVLGQLGWSMQMIHNSTGGRLPKYWRPPYGDSDMRVRSIAKEVFGLTTVVWNHDTEDWKGTSVSIGAALTGFLTGPKRPGLIILEHELTDVTVGSFITAYPKIKAAGWNFASLAGVIGDGRTYQNAQNSISNDVQPHDILATSAAPLSTSALVSQSSTLTSPSTSTSASLSTSSVSANNSNTKPHSSGLPAILPLHPIYFSVWVASLIAALTIGS